MPPLPFPAGRIIRDLHTGRHAFVFEPFQRPFDRRPILVISVPLSAEMEMPSALRPSYRSSLRTDFRTLR